MKKLHYNKKEKRIYWSFTENSSYIQMETNLDKTNTFVVMYVPQYGGSPISDSYFNNFDDAISQLEIISM